MPIGFGSFGTKRRENCFPWPRMEHIYCITRFDKLNRVFIIANALRATLVILARSMTNQVIALVKQDCNNDDDNEEAIFLDIRTNDGKLLNLRFFWHLKFY